MRIDLEGDPDAAVERGQNLHQSVQREAPETRVADSRQVRYGEIVGARLGRLAIQGPGGRPFEECVGRHAELGCLIPNRPMMVLGRSLMLCR